MTTIPLAHALRYGLVQPGVIREDAVPQCVYALVEVASLHPVQDTSPSRVARLGEDWEPSRFRPVWAHRKGGVLHLDDGHHRLRVAREFGASKIPAILYEGD